MELKKRIENHLVVFFLSTIVTGFLAGLGAYRGILRIAKLEVISQVQGQRFEMLATKDMFLSLYLRYALANLEPFRFEVTEDERKAAREKLDEYMLKYIDAADKTEAIVSIGKGQGTQTTIKFPDGSIWIVPPGFKAATRD